MAWELEVTDEFKAWFLSLSEDEQISVTRTAELLEERGPSLGRPKVETLERSSRSTRT